MIQVTQLSHNGVRTFNEDAVLVNEESMLFGVFDGASSLNSYLTTDGKTGGYVASNIAKTVFNNSTEDLKTTSIAANSAIEQAQIDGQIDIANNVNRFATTAAVARLLDNRGELLQVADSVAVVIYKNGHTEVPLGYHDQDIEIMRKWRQLADQGMSDIHNVVADDVISLRESANITYGVLNGDERAENFIGSTAISLANVATILLLTDGMYIPKADPDAPEDWNAYARLYQTGGLEEIYDMVRVKELTDPGLDKYPRYKLHDDASGVALDFICGSK